MKFVAAVLVSIAATVTPSAASAATYVLKLESVIGSISASDRQFKPIAVPKTSFAVGDTFAATMVFDTSRYYATALYDADPTINIYSGYAKQASMSFASHSTSQDDAYGSIQIWNDYALSSSEKIDSVSFSTGWNISSANSPVDFGAQGSFATFTLSNFDFSGLARKSDKIDEMPSLSSFSSSGSAGFVANRTSDVVAFSLNNIRATLTPLSAVPEPPSWMMMFLGFGAVGYTIRRKKAEPRFALPYSSPADLARVRVS